MLELALVEFPADDPERARRFWEGLLGRPFDEREEGEGRGRQTREDGVALGLHERGPGPGDRFSLPYFAVVDIGEALARVVALGGEVVHPATSGRSAATPRVPPSASPAVREPGRARNAIRGLAPGTADLQEAWLSAG
jgi:predicted enzyme related to lactoylglutathione lyase